MRGEGHPHFGLISQGMAPKDTQEPQSNGVGVRDKFWEAVSLALHPCSLCKQEMPVQDKAGRLHGLQGKTGTKPSLLH